MKYINTIKTIGLLVLCSCSVFAQELPTILPPSPEAASVFKSSEIPISLFTGVPNISIPLFQIQAKGISLPISINYNSKGIQVSEIASRVGMGWSLNYGGMISRQTRGKADENGSYGYLNNLSSSESFFTNSSVRTSIYTTNTNNPDYDFTPDQFYFSANNLSGKFILDQRDNKVVIQKFGNLLIDYTIDSGKIKSFVLKDGNGNKYYFGLSKNGNRFAADADNTLMNITCSEIDSPASSPSQGDVYYNTWHLMDIETAQGELIEFIYDMPEHSVHYQRSYDELVSGFYNVHFSKVRSEQYHIKEIRFNQGKLVFNKAPNLREDLNNGTFLKSIALYDKLDTKIKEFVLDHSYKISAVDTNQHNYLKTIEPEAGKRLFLDAVYEKATATDSLPGYVFQYSKIKLPNRHSNSQDYWGYYNGKSNGEYLKFNYSDVGSRAVDTLKSEAGLLKKITYPSGGSTSFEFEHNIVKNVFPKRVVFQSPNPITDHSTFLTHLDYNVNYSNGSFNKAFTVGGNVVGSVDYTVAFDDTTGCSASGNTPECKFLVSVKNLQTNVVFQLLLGQHTMTLTPGDYTLTIDPLDNNYNPIDIGNGFSVDLAWKEEIIDAHQLLYAGGKRIKKIEYKDTPTSVSFIKTYSYTDSLTGETSGQLFGLPGFYTLNPTYSSEGFYVYEPMGAVAGSILNTYQGGGLGYETVTEYYGDGNNTTGKTEYKFSMTPDTGLYYEFPYHLPTDNEWLRGQELKTTHFKKQTSAYIPAKKIENKYLFGDYTYTDPTSGTQSTPAVFNPIPIEKYLDLDMTIPSLSYLKNKRTFRLPIPIYTLRDSIINGEIVKKIAYKTYHLTAGTVDLLSTKITDYFDTTTVETTTTYDYDYNEHYNVAKTTTTTNSLGETVETKYYYPLDSEMSTKPVVSSLINKNMVGIPLVVESYNGTEKASEVETIYKDWGNGLLAPEIIKTSNGATLEERVKYTAVDPANGNPLEVQQIGGTPITYIWGYNKTQPIAKIENATYAQVQPYEANLQTLSNGTDEGNLITALNALRTALPNAIITTYTYKPLVGISTVTDPTGNKMTYHYDGFNRLQFVKDKNGSILSDNKYYYKN